MVKLRAARSCEHTCLYKWKENVEKVRNSSKFLPGLTHELPITRGSLKNPDSRGPPSRGKCVKHKDEPSNALNEEEVVSQKKSR